ncbi:hypothetical protein KIN20_008591 [Parelaphostrongylus tenuis]|uniref:C3HC-type domain-containing protein n=1 Tax=Parelaphostrongylus tenuis TaxID=148309 RepID=A0AAD5M4Z3_PARTN|nr:hypothetical protein KIN20_008591 [Parelaphostrongylus tenuis]
MDVEEADDSHIASATASEVSLGSLHELKRKAQEKLSSLTQTISPESSAKRSRICTESFSTYKALVKSYKFELWAGNEISPRELAVYGWECKAKDQVRCIACRQFLCTSVPKITDVAIDVYNRCIRRIREQILSSHLLTCLYRSKPLEFKHDIDEDFLNDVVRPRISTYDVEGLEMKMIVPELVRKNTERVKLSSGHSVVGASLGWSIETETIAGRKQFVAVCEYCARSFVLGYTDFDPVKTHQRWCPLLDINDDGAPLWMVIYMRMSPSMHQKTSPISIKDVERAKRLLSRSLSVISRETLCDSQ